MANDRYWSTWSEPGEADIGPAGMGSGGNDAWAVVARIPAQLLPKSTTQRLAIFVKGTLGEASSQGTNLPSRGLFQVCMGLDSGLKGQTHRASFGIRDTTQDVPTQWDGIPFGFLMVQQAGNGGDRPAISDPDFGPFLNTTALSGDIVLWARAAWNGDSLYTAAAKVSDVQWVIFDMDKLEANNDVRGRVDGPTTLSYPNEILVSQDPNDLGATGEKWLHMAALQYRTWSPSLLAPRFRVGHSTDGTWGTGSNMTTHAQVGQARGMLNNAGVELQKHSQPIVWHTTRPEAGHRLTITGTELQNAGAAFNTQVLWQTKLSINIGVLEDANVWEGTSTVQGKVATFSSPSPEEAYLPLERPAYSFRTVTTLFFAMQWGYGATGGSPATRGSSQLRITDIQNQFIRVPQSFVWVDGVRKENVQAITIVDVPMNPSAATQWHARMVSRTNNVTPNNAVDIHLASAFGIFEPSNAPTGPWVEPTPITLQIGREGSTPLPVLITAPDSVAQMSVEGFKHGEIVGATGYRRTWPTWLKPRRTWNLKWEPLTESAAETLETWIASNTRFQFTPPGQSVAINAMISGPIESERLGDGRSIVRINAVELVWVV